MRSEKRLKSILLDGEFTGLSIVKPVWLRQGSVPWLSTVVATAIPSLVIGHHGLVEPGGDGVLLKQCGKVHIGTPDHLPTGAYNLPLVLLDKGKDRVQDWLLGRGEGIFANPGASAISLN